MDVNNNFYISFIKNNIYMYYPSDKILLNNILKNIPNIIIEDTLNFFIN